MMNSKSNNKRCKKGGIQEWNINLPIQITQLSQQQQIKPSSHINQSPQKHNNQPNNSQQQSSQQQEQKEHKPQISQLLNRFIKFLIPYYQNSCLKQSHNNNNTPIDNTKQSIQFSATCQQQLRQIIRLAQCTSLSTLWNTQYTNHLSLGIYLIQQIINKNKIKKSTPHNITPQHPAHTKQEQNRDQSNNLQQSQQQQQHNYQPQQSKKKKHNKKIKKYHKKHQHNNNNNTISTSQKHNISHQKYNNNKQQQQPLINRNINVSEQINKILDNKQSIQSRLCLNMLKDRIQAQISRVQALLIQEMLNIHTLPYSQAQQKFIQSQSTSINKQSHNKKSTNLNNNNNMQYSSQKKYYSQTINHEQYIRQSSPYALPHNYQLNSNINASPFNHHNNTSPFNHHNKHLNTNNSNNNYPFLNSYQYHQLGQSNNNMNQSYQQYHYINQQHVKPYPIPLININPSSYSQQSINPSSFGQHLGQYMPQSNMFGSYGYDNFMMNTNINPTNNNMTLNHNNKTSIKKVQVKDNTNNKGKNTIDIDIENDSDYNNADDDDQVEQVQPITIIKRN